LGFDKIILVGQDLAFTGNKSHADGTFKETMAVEDTKDFLMVPGNVEKMVPTREDFDNYRKWFEEFIEYWKGIKDVQFINATEGGALIKGTQIMTLKDAISLYCTEMVDIKSCIAQLKPVFSEEEQKKIEKENALKLSDIKRNFESGYYSVVSDLVNTFPKNTKYEAEILYYKAMAEFKILENKKNDDNLQYNDIAETKNRITNIINNNQFKNSTFYSDVNNLLTNINSNYPKSQEEWNQIQEEKRKQEEKIKKEQQKTQAKLYRKNKSLGSFVAFGYEGGTIAKYGARLEIGGGSFMGFMTKPLAPGPYAWGASGRPPGPGRPGPPRSGASWRPPAPA
jgi:hypothetical protein